MSFTVLLPHLCAYTRLQYGTGTLSHSLTLHTGHVGWRPPRFTRSHTLAPLAES